MKRSENGLGGFVLDLDSLPEPLQAHVRELTDDPEAFQRRAAALEIAVSFYNVTLLAVIDNDIDNIKTLTAPLREMDEPTRVALGEALEWWSCSDEQTRADYLDRQQAVVSQIARRVVPTPE